MRSKYQATVSSGDIFALLSPSAESYIPATDRNPRAWQPQRRFWKVFPVDKEGGLLYFSFGLGPALCTADSDHRRARRGRKMHVIPDFWTWKWIPIGHGKGYLWFHADPRHGRTVAGSAWPRACWFAPPKGNWRAQNLYRLAFNMCFPGCLFLLISESTFHTLANENSTHFVSLDRTNFRQVNSFWTTCVSHQPLSERKGEYWEAVGHGHGHSRRSIVGWRPLMALSPWVGQSPSLSCDLLSHKMRGWKSMFLSSLQDPWWVAKQPLLQIRPGFWSLISPLAVWLRQVTQPLWASVC